MADAALPPEERDALAAEFALGVLEGEERARALRLQLSDAAFREAVSEWEFHLGQLYRATPEVTPPNLWPAIAARLPQDVASANDNGAGMARRLQLWRMTGILSGAAAAALAILVVTRPGPQTPLPPVVAPQPAATTAIVAKLGESDAPAQLVVNYDPDKGELRIRPIALPASELTPELWVIPASGGAPRSLGLFAAQGASDVKVAQALRQLLADGATLAVSLEKREGAPHQAPSSTPIAAGTMHRL